MAKTRGLGRGLGSLIPSEPKQGAKKSSEIPVSPSSDSQEGLHEIPIHKIDVNPHQPRKHFSAADLEDLISSIKEHGILQPLVVTIRDDGSFELIAGERRLRASKMLGLDAVPAIVRTADDQQKLELAIIENTQRQDLNAIEEAVAYKSMIDGFSMTQDQVAKRVGKSRSAVANVLRLLELAEEIQQAIIEGQISKSHARTLLSERDEKVRLELFSAMLAGDMTVRQAESKAGAKKSGNRSKSKKSPDILDYEKQLREKFGTRVDIQDKNGSGKVILHYYSKEELKSLLKDLES